MNKKIKGKQSILRDKWYEKDSIWIVNPIIFQDAQGTLIPKKIQ